MTPAATTANSPWPELPLSDWHGTRDTLHLWLQIVGKIRMLGTPLVNHWWNVPLYLTARGLTTSLMQHPLGSALEIDVDFVAQRLDVLTTSGAQQSVEDRSRLERPCAGAVRRFRIDRRGLA
jgi:hypothetical protein